MRLCLFPERIQLFGGNHSNRAALLTLAFIAFLKVLISSIFTSESFGNMPAATSEGDRAKVSARSWLGRIMVVQGYRGKACGGRVELKPFRTIYDTWEQTPEQRLFGRALTWLLILPFTHAPPKFRLFSDIVLYTGRLFSGLLAVQNGKLLCLAARIFGLFS